MLPKAGKHSFEALQILIVRTDTNDYIINVNVNTGNVTENMIQQTLKVGGATIQALGGTAISKLPVSRDGETGGFLGSTRVCWKNPWDKSSTLKVDPVATSFRSSYR